MSPTITIDRDSPPGSYRAALAPNAASCRACGQHECAHPDAIYQGVIPVTAISQHFHSRRASRA